MDKYNTIQYNVPSRLLINHSVASGQGSTNA